jgi:hypothetical protein
MQTQTEAISNHGIEVTELDVEEINIESLSDDQHLLDDPVVKNPGSQYAYPLDHQMVA